MTLVFTRRMSPETPYLVATMLSDICRPRQRPAVTLTGGVLRAKARSLRPPAERPPRPRPGRYRWDPLRSMMHRGTARLRHAIQVEDAIRHTAIQVAAEPPRVTAEGGKHTLALPQDAERPIVALRYGLFAYADTGELVELDPVPQDGESRQAQAP